MASIREEQRPGTVQRLLLMGSGLALNQYHQRGCAETAGVGDSTSGVVVVMVL